MLEDAVIIDSPCPQSSHEGTLLNDSYHEKTLELYLRQLLRQERCKSHQGQTWSISSIVRSLFPILRLNKNDSKLKLMNSYHVKSTVLIALHALPYLNLTITLSRRYYNYRPCSGITNLHFVGKKTQYKRG